MPTFPTRSWRDIVLGTDPLRRRRVSRWLPIAGVYGFSLMAQGYGVYIGRADPVLAAGLGVLVVLGMALMYALMRSSAGRRIDDVRFTLAQTAFAIVCLTLAYALNPEVRGMLLMIVVLALVHGAFQLPARDCVRLGWAAVALLGLTMASLARLSPDVFDPVVEGTHFMFCLLVLPTVARLAAGMSRTRLRLEQQEEDLHAALDHIGVLATLDELTGLPNRRHVQELLSHCVALADPKRRPLSVCLFNIDHFKRINETLGHGAGDEVLRMIGLLADPLLGESDVLARWDGEEFLLVLPDTPADLAFERAECLRLHLAEPLNWGARPELQVSFSGGVTMHRPGEAVHKTLERAMSLLRQAKSSGRDRVLLG
jgi:diguanylate cyclase (GGDEF)-like protein